MHWRREYFSWLLAPLTYPRYNRLTPVLEGKIWLASVPVDGLRHVLRCYIPYTILSVISVQIRESNPKQHRDIVSQPSDQERRTGLVLSTVAKCCSYIIVPDTVVTMWLSIHTVFFPDRMTYIAVISRHRADANPRVRMHVTT